MFAMLLGGAVVIIGAALPSFLNNAAFSKRDKVAVLIFTAILLVAGIVASNAFEILYDIFVP